jgi:pseudouridine synthase
VEKEYEVTLDAPLTTDQVQALARGVDLEDGRTLPCVVERLRNSRVRMVLREGRNRQIRRMMDIVGRRVVRLVRSRIGGLELGELGVGKFRQAGESDLMLLERDGPKGG